MFKKILLSLFVIYSLISFVILPFVLKSQIVKMAATQMDVNLSIESVFFNPFSFELEISGVTLEDLQKKKLASLNSIKIDLEPHSLLKPAIHIKDITIEKPQIFVVYNKDKTFNFGKLLKEKKSDENITSGAKESSGLPRIVVDTIRVSDGLIDYQDFTNKSKFEFSIDSIDFKLKNIDTNDFNCSDATFRFNSSLGDGGTVDFRSKIIGFKPLKVEGNLKFESSKLYTEWKYMRDRLGLEVADGSITFGADYRLNADDLNSTIIENINLSLENLRVKPKNKNSDILNLKSFTLNDATIKPMMHSVHVKNISLKSLDTKVKRDSNGEIDWVGYLKNTQESPEDKKAETKAHSNSATWKVVVENIALNKIGVDVEDISVTPSVKTKLNELNVELKNLTLAGEEPLAYEMNLLLNDKVKCSSNGTLKHKILELNSYVKCSDFDIVHYRPYIDQIASNELKTYNVALKSATVAFDTSVTLRDENSQINTLVKGGNITLEKFALDKKENSQKLVNFRSFEVKGVNLDSKTKDVLIEKVSLNDLEVDAKKERNGAINLIGLIEARESNATKKGALQDVKTKEEPYRVKLKSFDINSAKVSFDDRSIKKGTKTVIDKINLGAKDIDSKEKSTFKYDLALRVNNRGAIKSKGEIKHTPLEQKGSLVLSKISLKELTPYIQEFSFLKISDGYVSLNSKTTYKQKDDKSSAAVNGNLKVEEFFLHDSRDNSTIASFIKADLKSFNFKTAPNSLYIDEILLDSFYVDAQIDENKSMNLAKLMKEEEQKEKKEQKVVQKSSQIQKQDDEKFVFKVLKLKVSKGSANFADYSLPIDFKTSIHDLNGDVYAISNNKGEVTHVDIDGEVDEYGSTKLKGSLDSSNVKSFMDIDFNFKNLDLNSFSGYSAQFAGYKIEKGKLFLDLKYKINNSELQSKNSIVIKNIELGDEVEDENITKLPLSFAIALLEDSDGVIDINMPIEGNVDKPDFKYGAMVLKALVNLIAKAVTAPFRFLGEMLGIDAEELKNIDFEAGKAVILPPEREKLDNLANILVKKPKLSLSITGGFDNDRDLKAIKAEKLKQKVLEISKQEHPTTQVLEKIYSHTGKNIKTLKNEVEKRVKENMFNVEYQKELYTQCLDTQSVAPEELMELAGKRANMIQDYLAVTKGIDASKIFVKEAKEVSDLQNDLIGTMLEIGVK